MNSSDDDIVMNESGEIETSSFSHNNEFRKEDAAMSLRELEDEGISILEDDHFPQGQNTHDQISRDLFKEAGIEILSDEEDESFS